MMNRLDITELPNRLSTLAKFDATSITDDDGWSLGCDTSGADLIIGSLVEYWGLGIGYTEFEGDEPTAAENVLAFPQLPWEQQSAAGISPEHSGNSFAFACRLAYRWVTDPGLVEIEHGALTPLVGCVNYGCTHEPPPAADERAVAAPR